MMRNQPLRAPGGFWGLLGAPEGVPASFHSRETEKQDEEHVDDP